ncbi:SigE family RNA polymerase sigma factor [Saccharomonospora glauca]|uniref:RNA polymerase sigma-70 factor, sigma-E family n=1 Tax=Saccharomonospora glauca K62 TaxID=928724 RepID=I1CZ51_9PSEU|nr:SigE family RNA polymerase sigma factor [Saccharomonospora glauca]EIE97975.1 RNA polymerase sigma-70 factor, sigma-E family [Saccharomonospora glauca K62]
MTDPTRNEAIPRRFEDFVQQRLERLLRYATALTCDPHLAEDVVQDVLLRAQRRWDRISSLDAPDAYVRRMVTNEYLSWRRRRAARHVSTTHEALEALSAPVADHATYYAERDAMRARIATLPRKQRAALVLRYYENLTHAEIAGALGCSEGTVRSHISRALSVLRATAPTGAVKEVLA